MSRRTAARWLLAIGVVVLFFAWRTWQDESTSHDAAVFAYNFAVAYTPLTTPPDAVNHTPAVALLVLGGFAALSGVVLYASTPATSRTS